MDPNKINLVNEPADNLESGSRSEDSELSDESQLTPGCESESFSSASSAVKWRNKVTLEPMLLVCNIASSCCLVNVQSFYIDSICHQLYSSTNDSICSNLTAFKDEEKAVEALASIYFSYRGLIEAGLPILFVLFLGPWSDKHGSKTPMIISLLGYMVSTIIYTILSKVPNISPNIILFASVPIALSGGMCALVLSAFRYISEITAIEERTFRIAMVNGFWALGAPFGLLGSVQILKYGDFTIVFMTAAILYSISVIYAVLFIRNDKSYTEEDCSNKCTDLFDVAAVKETFVTLFKSRPGSLRLWVCILVFNFGLVTLTYGGGNVQFIVTRSILQWNSQIYSVFSTFDGIMGSSACILASLLLVNLFKLRDNAIAVISSVTFVAGCIIQTFVSSTWMMYLGSGVQVLGGLTTTCIRAMLSKQILNEELGKIFAILACTEAVMPLTGTLLYNFVFRETITSSLPGSVFLLSGAIQSVSLILFVYLLVATRKVNQTIIHNRLEEENC